ncbi:IclR family transcriptional regulator [Pelagovum pacificum]|uniref:IclR family transcriptional regulator n=1 Tax=Pelagovum pacificum TaxID=2588711 RepID=A0A5C5GEA7_9RHOB|nr:IclR family transcriptional regulator [Pelagovum pacificum]QQA43827.1 IclR family transcriptional regulator [Pelagovum pacificum]TNY33043.1 IclR family transcriptional regulator [Pelagovum pacificum]
MSVSVGSDTSEPKEKRGINSIRVGFRLIRALLDADRPMTLTELSRAAGMPTGQAHLYLVSFAGEGLLLHDSRTGSYSLGPTALRLGLGAMRRMDVLDLSQEVIDALSARTGYNCYVSVWSGLSPVLVQKSESAESIFPVALRLGGVVPLLSTVAGLVYVSMLDGPELDEAIARERAGASGRAAAFVERVAEEKMDEIRRRVREQGCATSDLLARPASSAIAVPVFDYQKRVSCVIGLVGPPGVMDLSLDGKSVAAVLEAASTLADRIAGSITPPR